MKKHQLSLLLFDIKASNYCSSWRMQHLDHSVTFRNVFVHIWMTIPFKYFSVNHRYDRHFFQRPFVFNKLNQYWNATGVYLLIVFLEVSIFCLFNIYIYIPNISLLINSNETLIPKILFGMSRLVSLFENKS